MNTLIIFDSLYGNTQAIAAVMGEALAKTSNAKVVGVNDVSARNLDDLQLLIVGSPTQGGRPTEGLQKLLNSLVDGSLVGVKVAAFDTRFLEKKQSLPLKLLMKTIGYAAEKIAVQLQKKGGELVLPPEGFIVEGKQGPLANGEVDRAKVWALQCVKALSQ